MSASLPEVYADHAASTPLRPEARAAWLDAQDVVGNASSVHRAGQRARRMLEESREAVAAALGCEPIEVVFTSGGTESINLALQGLWSARSRADGTIVLPDGEHHATLDTVSWLSAHAGAEVATVPIDAVGRISSQAFAAALPHAAVATALAANNEVGTVNPVASLASAAADADVPLHIDAIGAVGALPVSFTDWRGSAPAGGGLVAMSVAGHKLGAPVGTGALVVARTARLHPLLHGGGQQRGLRSGSQDVAGAVAFAAAVSAAVVEREASAARLAVLRDALVSGIRREVPEAVLLGDERDRLPGNAHFLFPGAPGESLLYLLDRDGISASTGSACQAGVPEPSHVVLAMGRDDHEARQVLRFTFGSTSSAADVEHILSVLADAYRRARGAAPAARP